MRYKIDWPQRYGQPKADGSVLVSKMGKVVDFSPDMEWSERMDVSEVILRVQRLGAVVECVSADCYPLKKKGRR